MIHMLGARGSAAGSRGWLVVKAAAQLNLTASGGDTAIGKLAVEVVCPKRPAAHLDEP